MDDLLACPECKSTKVTTEHHQMFMVNTEEHHCHSMKPHDDDSPATCLDCRWKGVRKNLIHVEDPKKKKREEKERKEYERLKAKFGPRESVKREV